MTNNSKPII